MRKETLESVSWKPRDTVIPSSHSSASLCRTVPTSVSKRDPTVGDVRPPRGDADTITPSSRAVSVSGNWSEGSWKTLRRTLMPSLISYLVESTVHQIAGTARCPFALRFVFGLTSLCSMRQSTLGARYGESVSRNN